MPNNTELPEWLKKDIDTYMSSNHPYVWPQNKHGEDMVQPVGHVNPPFWRKHQKQIAPIRDAAEHYASIALGLRDALEAIASGIALPELTAKQALTLFPVAGEGGENG